MTFANLMVLQDLARRRWDLAVIISLAGGALRYVDVRTAGSRWAGTPLADSELSRTLPRLVKGGFVTRQRKHGLDDTYTLTSEGRARLALCQALNQAIDAYQQ